MMRAAAPPRTPKARTPTLAQQQADFTAEGSPPPGNVATSVPPGTHNTPKGPVVRKKWPRSTGR
jgi:hypothetical protein